MTTAEHTYSKFVAQENFDNAHKNEQKCCKIFKPSVHNAQRQNFKNKALLVLYRLCKVRMVVW